MFCFRCSLLLASYPTTMSEDEKMLESTPTTCSAYQAILMRLCEKKILMDAVYYAKRKWDELHTTLPTEQ